MEGGGISSFYAHSFLILFSSVFFMASSTSNHMDPSSATLIRVDPSGNGDFRTIQDAVDAIPSNNKEYYSIQINPGTYREKVVVPANKPYVTLSGTHASSTIITWNNGGDIFDSPTVTILASEFVGQFLTIQNTYGTSARAVALRVEGDRVAFHSCKFMSYQDTLLDDAGTHYYSNCYIEGATDFICGNAASVFEMCHLHSISTEKGSITAQHRSSPMENTGFTFLGCKITGVGQAFLGRPWGAYSRVVFVMTYMSSVIAPEGWDDWPEHNRHGTVYYGEYKSYGPGAETSKRVQYSHNLSDDEVEPYLNKDMIGGTSWLRSEPTHYKKFTGSLAKARYT